MFAAVRKSVITQTPAWLQFKEAVCGNLTYILSGKLCFEVWNEIGEASVILLEKGIVYNVFCCLFVFFILNIKAFEDSISHISGLVIKLLQS